MVKDNKCLNFLIFTQYLLIQISSAEVRYYGRISYSHREDGKSDFLSDEKEKFIQAMKQVLKNPDVRRAAPGFLTIDQVWYDDHHSHTYYTLHYDHGPSNPPQILKDKRFLGGGNSHLARQLQKLRSRFRPGINFIQKHQYEKVNIAAPIHQATSSRYFPPESAVLNEDLKTREKTKDSEISEGYKPRNSNSTVPGDKIKNDPTDGKIGFFIISLTVSLVGVVLIGLIGYRKMRHQNRNKIMESFKSHGKKLSRADGKRKDSGRNSHLSSIEYEDY